MDEETKLKPCPAYGSENLSRSMKWVSCRNCRLIGPDPDFDRTKWNAMPRNETPAPVEPEVRTLHDVVGDTDGRYLIWLTYPVPKFREPNSGYIPPKSLSLMVNDIEYFLEFVRDDHRTACVIGRPKEGFHIPRGGISTRNPKDEPNAWIGDRLAVKRAVAFLHAGRDVYAAFRKWQHEQASE